MEKMKAVQPLFPYMPEHPADMEIIIALRQMVIQFKKIKVTWFTVIKH
jgi:hypothetical protein